VRPAETLGSLGSALHAGLERVTVGIEISATHHRAASAGLVTGIASLLHGGRTTTTYEVVISDEAGRRVCTSRLTCLLMDRVPGKGGPGRGDRPHPPTVTGRRPPVVTAVAFRATAHPVRHKANHSRRDVYGIPTGE
jgi:Thioesterase superfamily